MLKLFRRLRARKFGVPFYDPDFYVYTAWWMIEKEPAKWGWPDGVKFTKEGIDKLYHIEPGGITPLANVGNLTHEYKLIEKHGVHGSDHLPGGSVEFEIEYWHTYERTGGG